MAKLKQRSISRSTVEAMKVDRDTVFWDRDQPGFGVRVFPPARRCTSPRPGMKGNPSG